jgi:hypothetical protein
VTCFEHYNCAVAVDGAGAGAGAGGAGGAGGGAGPSGASAAAGGGGAGAAAGPDIKKIITFALDFDHSPKLYNFLFVIYEFLYYTRVFVRLSWKSLLRTNTQTYYKNS